MGRTPIDGEKDDFWDLSLLLPKRGAKKAPSPPFGEPRMAEVTAPPSPDAPPARPQEELSFSTRRAPAEREEVREYHPQSNRLIDTVRVYRRVEEYPFYGQFRRDALRYLDETAEECPFTHFFSYIPQYSQLTPAQRQYYFYWRSRVRAGEYPRTEESYFYLYVYEIINLPDRIPPQEGVLLLCRVWAAYRAAFPRVDKYMTEWLCDYCLVHELPCPDEELRPFRAKILPYASCREFYLGGMGDLTPAGVDTALAFFSDYRWRDSRYAAGEGYPLFETHIIGALTGVLRDRLERGKSLYREAARTRRTHDAFCGSLCAHNVKCRIELLYYAVADVAPLRTALTASVKYAENKLRALLSVKSRLSVQGPDPLCRALIDEYFARVGQAIRGGASPEERPAYEQLYDAPTQGVDFAVASRIEQSSWGTTRLLVSEEGPAPEPVDIPVREDSQRPTDKVKPDTKNEADIENASQATEEEARAPEGDAAYPHALTGEEVAYLRLLLSAGSGAARALARSQGRMEEELAGAINEKSMAGYGDVVLEMTEDGYAVIPDYQEEVAEWIR